MTELSLNESRHFVGQMSERLPPQDLSSSRPGSVFKTYVLGT